MGFSIWILPRNLMFSLKFATIFPWKFWTIFLSNKNNSDKSGIRLKKVIVSMEINEFSEDLCLICTFLYLTSESQVQSTKDSTSTSTSTISYWTFGGTIVRIIQNFWGTIVKIIASFEGRSPEKIAIFLLLSRKNLNNSNYCPDKSSITDLFDFWGMIQTMHPPLRRIFKIISTKRRGHTGSFFILGSK